MPHIHYCNAVYPWVDHHTTYFYSFNSSEHVFSIYLFVYYKSRKRELKAKLENESVR
jgi:hypothetical protein